MTVFVTHTAILTSRHLRSFIRMPAYVVMNLVQPMIWLLLFGQLFRSVVDIPGFSGGSSYLEFLTPGIVMMMALFGSAWAGTAYIADMGRGVMDRYLTAPTSRGALVLSTMLYQGVLTIIQTVVVLGVARASGARLGGGAIGVGVILLAAVLLTLIFAAFSDAVALVLRTQEALIGISQLVSFPLMFLSSAIMDTSLAPAWVGDVARFNPFEWAVVAGRGAVSSVPNWGEIWANVGMLAALSAVMMWIATQAFRAYQRAA